MVLTRFFERQYCSKPAALLGLIVLIFGNAEAIGGAENGAFAVVAAQATTSASTALSMILDLSSRSYGVGAARDIRITAGAWKSPRRVSRHELYGRSTTRCPFNSHVSPCSDALTLVTTRFLRVFPDAMHVAPGHYATCKPGGSNGTIHFQNCVC